MEGEYIGIKKDTTFPIEVGGNTLINLQKLILYVVEGKSEAEIENAQKHILKNEYPDEWIEHFAFLSFFIRHIEQVAHSKGLTVMEKLDGLPIQQNS
jgi:hypothetical protein